MVMSFLCLFGGHFRFAVFLGFFVFLIDLSITEAPGLAPVGIGQLHILDVLIFIYLFIFYLRLKKINKNTLAGGVAMVTIPNSLQWCPTATRGRSFIRFLAGTSQSITQVVKGQIRGPDTSVCWGCAAHTPWVLQRLSALNSSLFGNHGG